MKTFFANLHNKIWDSLRRSTMKNQLMAMFFVAVLVPILIFGVILITVNMNSLISYEQDMAISNNRTVRAMLYEITSQIYNVSEEITYDDSVVEALSRPFADAVEFQTMASVVDDQLDYFARHYASIDSVTIYVNNEFAVDADSVRVATAPIQRTVWYNGALSRYSVAWTPIKSQDLYGNVICNLSLVRRIPLYESASEAVLVIKLSENYLRSRIEEEHYHTILTMDDGYIAYSSNRPEAGTPSLFYFPEKEAYYTETGRMEYHGASYLGHTSTLAMIKSDSYIHITTLSLGANGAISHTVINMVVLVMIGLALPVFIMRVFTRSILNQVTSLRNKMYKASTENYELGEFVGCYELTQAYNDLLTLIERIQDNDARMFNNEISKQKLLNEQQKMEFKMLASQINPHFLYNTLEMIRMKALAGGDRETATAIRLLGQSMRYVLDNTGTEYTTLAKELKHIEIYLQIQKLRFGDRVNYYLQVDHDVDLEEVQMLPLLLQPIVENAVLHGLEEVESGGRIDVHVYKETYNVLRITISDNGCGMDEESLAEMRRNLQVGHINNRYGIGLYNINRRLRINYGEGFGLTIDSKLGEGTIVSARLRIDPKL